MMYRLKVGSVIAGMAGLLFFLIYPPPGSHLPAKEYRVNTEISVLNRYADYYREALLKTDNLNNSDFVKITVLTGSAFKFDEEGEVLDPWGKPYVVTKTNDKIIITSP